MSFGGGKGGEQKTEVEIPDELKKEAVKNLELANYVSRLPLMQNFGGQVAAFTPQQQAGMQASDSAAASLGMPTAGFGPNTGMNIPGMPQAQDFGGIQAYSTQPVYEDAMSRVPPEIRQMYESLFQPGAAPGANANNTGSRSVSPNQGYPPTSLGYRDWMELSDAERERFSGTGIRPTLFGGLSGRM